MNVQMTMKKLMQWFRRLFYGGEINYISSTQTLPPPLTAPEEKHYCQMLLEGDESARNCLVVHNLRLVVYIAKKFESSGVAMDDIVSIGTIGLIKAVNTFSPEKKIKLATYASRCIENEILMYLRKASNRRQDASIDEPLNVDSDGNELLLSDVLGSEPDLVGQQLEQTVEHQALRQAISMLTPREQQIMEMRYGLRDGKERTQKEVADQIGISQSYISRLEKRIIQLLRKKLEAEF